MTRADWLCVWLLGNYAVIGGAYAWQGDWARFLYWLGAMLIVFATIQMK